MSRPLALREDIAESFKGKGLKFISLTGSSASPEGSTLIYADASGKEVRKEIDIRLSELEDTIAALDAIDPTVMADFLLK